MLISPENSVIWQNSRWKREMEIPSGGNINNVVVGNFCFSKVLHTIVTIVFDRDMTW